MTSIDLNADLGEGYSSDADLMPLISSCNVACGGHAGDDASMRQTIQLALEHEVAIGAHPSYPDREGFGRRSGIATGNELIESVLAQCRALDRVAAASGARVTHIKPHGALYNDAAADPDIAGQLVAAANRWRPDVRLLGPPNSALSESAVQSGLTFVAEGFVDRCYLASGALVPRSEPGAVHSAINVMTTQALALAEQRGFTSQCGSTLRLSVATLCIHGDTDNAVVVASAVHDVLASHGIAIRAFQ